MRTLIWRPLTLGGLWLLAGCLGTHDLAVGELDPADPPLDRQPDDAGLGPDDASSNGDVNAAIRDGEVEAAAQPPPREIETETRHDAAVLEAGARDGGRPDAGGSDAATLDAATRDAATDASHDAADGSGDAGRSLLCTFEPWHCT